MLVAALRMTAALATLFAVVLVAFLLLAFGAMYGVTALTRAGGWAGLLAGAMAWYLCLAGVLSRCSAGRCCPTSRSFAAEAAEHGDRA